MSGPMLEPCTKPMAWRVRSRDSQTVGLTQIFERFPAAAHSMRGGLFECSFGLCGLPLRPLAIKGSSEQTDRWSLTSVSSLPLFENPQLFLTLPFDLCSHRYPFQPDS